MGLLSVCFSGFISSLELTSGSHDLWQVDKAEEVSGQVPPVLQGVLTDTLQRRSRCPFS